MMMEYPFWTRTVGWAEAEWGLNGSRSERQRRRLKSFMIPTDRKVRASFRFRERGHWEGRMKKILAMSTPWA
jgi:hypothetical protein